MKTNHGLSPIFFSIAIAENSPHYIRTNRGETNVPMGKIRLACFHLG